MPEHNLIQNPGVLLRLQQFLGIRQMHVSPALSENVQGVVIIGDVRDTGGTRQLVRPCWGSSSQTAAAGQIARVALFNPTQASGFNSGVSTIITVREIRINDAQSAGAVQFSMVIEPGGSYLTGVPPFPPKFRHARAADPTSTGTVANLPVGQLSRLSSGAGTVTAFAVDAIGTSEVVYSNDIVLLPGWRLVVQNDVVTTGGIQASFTWEEEDLEQSQ